MNFSERMIQAGLEARRRADAAEAAARLAAVPEWRRAEWAAWAQKKQEVAERLLPRALQAVQGWGMSLGVNMSGVVMSKVEGFPKALAGPPARAKDASYGTYSTPEGIGLEWLIEEVGFKAHASFVVDRADPFLSVQVHTWTSGGQEYWKSANTAVELGEALSIRKSMAQVSEERPGPSQDDEFAWKPWYPPETPGYIAEPD